MENARPVPSPAECTGDSDTRDDSVLLDAAATEFFNRGFEGASIRAIVLASGCSTGDVYRRFGNKKNLFREVVLRHADLSLPRSNTLVPSERSVEDDLAEFGRAYVIEFLEEASLSILRMVITEAALMPDVVARLWEVGPKKTIDHVAGYLKAQLDRGRVRLTDPELAAAQYLDMIKAGMHVRLQMTGIRPSVDEIEKSTNYATRIFARGIE